MAWLESIAGALVEPFQAASADWPLAAGRYWLDVVQIFQVSRKTRMKPPPPKALLLLLFLMILYEAGVDDVDVRYDDND